MAELMSMAAEHVDASETPFIERLEDIRRIHLELPEPLDVAYAIGALTGLRTGEVFAPRFDGRTSTSLPGASTCASP